MYADYLILGGGTSGAVLAGRLAERTDARVVVVEAGPDFGPRGDTRWPSELVDATVLGLSNEWGYTSGGLIPGREVPFERCRAIGGCSSHNGCAAIWGHRLDYTAWGLDGWTTAELEPLFRAANERMRVARPAADDVTPIHRAVLEAFGASGIPLVDDLNDLDEDVGGSTSPANIVDGTRFNAAFAYLDPVRERPNLEIVDRALAAQVILDGARCVGADLIRDGRPERIEADHVIVAGGTYGSPAILLRSGIGPAADLRGLGIEPVVDLPVGANLHDHPAVELEYRGTPALATAWDAWATGRFAPVEQTIAKVRSSHAREAFDIHIYPVGGRDQHGELVCTIPVACMTPQARGTLRLRSTDPQAAPIIDHAYLGDPRDEAVLEDAVAIGREVGAQRALRELFGDETERSRRPNRDRVVHYYHPVGTCAMGAVCDERGRVRGVDGLSVCDCSLMPQVPRANTNIPAVVIGERIARFLAP